ncbi:8-amino-7-oxononanoate synthase [Nocardioides albertanoniae]|uniref:8-amino-7-oxononanoate synthase n=1 Tax=Nocardioides albertanoniae TaxID=1175486 RepID=A0A543A590_9ACTN|nr:8-amino-7-oxononanoate synthase [Nocardioides albertanoniae]TQL67755.1 8-amino-7-oxononanoate synthase [Nocardioides albertanoniae]
MSKALDGSPESTDRGRSKTRWESWIAEAATAREAAGLTRRLRPRGPGDDTIDLAGNDYLGLSRHPDVRRAAADAALLWGGGAGASRLVTGTLRLHQELEHELADWLGQPTALTFSTGYHANLSVVGALADRSAHVVSDAHIHASLIDAVRLSRAQLTVVPHNDVAAVRAALAARPGVRTLVLAESIYSVLGDEAPLTELAAACAEHGALLVVDEAHGVGVHGPGLVHRRGLAGRPDVLVTATLSKSLGSQGGAVLGPGAVLDHLVNTARPFIFDTGLAPASTAAALAAARVARSGPDLADTIRARVTALARALGVAAPAGAVLSVPMPSPEAAVAAQADLLAEGVRVGCFRPPSVPDGVSRLRVTAGAGVTEEAWERACKAIDTIVGEVR